MIRALFLLPIFSPHAMVRTVELVILGLVWGTVVGCQTSRLTQRDSSAIGPVRQKLAPGREPIWSLDPRARQIEHNLNSAREAIP